MHERTRGSLSTILRGNLATFDVRSMGEVSLSSPINIHPESRPLQRPRLLSKTELPPLTSTHNHHTPRPASTPTACDTNHTWIPNHSKRRNQTDSTLLPHFPHYHH